ncbi:MAG TPA: hypothetical protein VM899_08585 [Rubellimicrobium sp.]|nr:hypothetical protein [Rubellimicrobium sp.]
MLAGAALVLLALWLGLSSFGITRWVAIALGLGGLALVWTGAQRLRFGRGGGGPGIVTVDERRLVYWGPLTGGVMDMDGLARLDLDPAARPAHWVLTSLRGERLEVPVTAQGAEALFDLFAALPGLPTETMLATLQRTSGPPVTLWRAPNVILLPPQGQRRLH